MSVGGSPVGSVTVAFPVEARSPALDIAWTWILATALLALAIAVVASWVVTRFLVGPLHRKTDAAPTFTPGNRGSQDSGNAPWELGELAAAFTGMAYEVERSDRNRCDLTADVAHELPTPLAALQAGLEELRDGLVSPSPELLAALHDQLLKLGRVIADFAELSEAETAGPLSREG